MKLLRLQRTKFSDECTIGTLCVEGSVYWYTLEDRDRGLHSLMAPQAISEIKVRDLTAIPYGFYEVVMDFSNRFQRIAPHILNVPGFDGIRIHAGNTSADTSGCPILGKSVSDASVGNSRVACQEFEKWLTEALKNDRVFISVCR